MNTEEQISLVFDIAERKARQIEKEIRAGKIPESWEGIEFYWLLSERMTYSTHNSPALKQRKRDYNNTVLVNGL